MRSRTFYIIYLFFFIGTLSISAKIKLPSLFGNGMVLQQQSETFIWGTSKENTKVDLVTSWNQKAYSITSDKNGKWKIKISTPEAGGPYAITISDGSTLELNNVLIGEVWVCSGQSNMFMNLKGNINQPVLGSNKAIATSRNSQIRFFTVARKASLEPKDNFGGTWQESSPSTAANFSATAYFFGKMLQEVLQVPVGLISTSWGGTAIEPWISQNELKKYDWVPEPALDDEGKVTQRIPSALFNAMIHPIIGYTFKGAIWYQGESNRREPEKYEKLLPSLISDWRKEMQIGDFPFYYAQIAPYDYGTHGLNSAFYVRPNSMRSR